MPDVSPNSIHLASQRILHDSHYASRCVLVAVVVVVVGCICSYVSGLFVFVIWARPLLNTSDRQLQMTTQHTTHTHNPYNKQLTTATSRTWAGCTPPTG